MVCLGGGMVDTADLKSAGSNTMGVRVSPEARCPLHHKLISLLVAVAQLVRASGCGPEGRGFDSRQLPQKNLMPKQV